MLSDATSGLNSAAGRSRSSTVIDGAPPVVRLMTASRRCLMRGRNGANASGLWSGLPVFGIARMQVDDRGAGLGGADRGVGDLGRGVTGR